MHYNSCLSINRLRLSVHLGVGEGERSKPQPIEITARLYFPELPNACHNDNAVFICYDMICSALLEYAENKEFKLIEYLTLRLTEVIKASLQAQIGEKANHAKLWIKLHKCIPPVPYMLDGASFIYSDLPESISAVDVA
jgi:dihydroneopterin aldolase